MDTDWRAMDAAWVGESARYDVGVFAGFVADLRERAGFDRVFVDPAATGRANVIGRRDGEEPRTAASLTPDGSVAADPVEECPGSHDATPSDVDVDTVAVAVVPSLGDVAAVFSLTAADGRPAGRTAARVGPPRRSTAAGAMGVVGRGQRLRTATVCRPPARRLRVRAVTRSDDAVSPASRRRRRRAGVVRSKGGY
jgi:hypothetical protein